MKDGNPLWHLEKLLVTPELPSLGPDARKGREPVAALEKKLEEAFVAANTSAKNKNLIRSLILLWHDHLDESHSISQEIHNSDGSFLHGIMHRREPDYGNSKYWFNRVGKHPAFPQIATRVAAALKNDHSQLALKLVPQGEWDPFAFVDACEQATKSSSDVQVLQRVQEIEFRVLLDHFCQ